MTEGYNYGGEVTAIKRGWENGLACVCVREKERERVGGGGGRGEGDRDGGGKGGRADGRCETKTHRVDDGRGHSHRSRNLADLAWPPSVSYHWIRGSAVCESSNAQTHNW